MSVYSQARFKRALKYFIGGRLIQSAAFAILLFWLVRLLDAVEYGQYMTLLALVELLVPLTSLGLIELVQRYVPELVQRVTRQSLARFCYVMLAVRSAVLILATALLWWQWHWVCDVLQLGPPDGQIATIFAVMAAAVIGFRFVSDMLEALLEQGRSQLIRAFMPVGRLIGIAGLVAMGHDIDLLTVLVVELATTVICLLMSLWALRQCIRQLPASGDGGVAYACMLPYARHMALATWLNAAGSPWIHRLIIAAMLGMEAAGLFGFLQQLMQLVGRYLPATLLASVIRPMLISRYVASRDIRVLDAGTGLLWKVNLIILACACAITAVGGDALVALASGDKYQDAGMILLVLMLTLIFNAQRQMLEMVMQIIEWSQQISRLALLGMLSTLLLALGSSAGIEFAVSGLIVGAVLWNVVAMTVLSRYGMLPRLDWGGGVRVLLLTFVIAIIAWWMGLAMDNTILISGVIPIIYLVGMLVIRPLQTRDVQLLVKVAQRSEPIVMRFARVNKDVI